MGRTDRNHLVWSVRATIHPWFGGTGEDEGMKLFLLNDAKVQAVPEGSLVAGTTQGSICFSAAGLITAKCLDLDQRYPTTINAKFICIRSVTKGDT